MNCFNFNFSGTIVDADDVSSGMSAAIESSRDSDNQINCVDEESQEKTTKSSGDTQCSMFLEKIIVKTLIHSRNYYFFVF